MHEEKNEKGVRGEETMHNLNLLRPRRGTKGAPSRLLTGSMGVLLYTYRVFRVYAV
jgi:hypothetical protein